ncbi:MAG: glycosyltransferase family 2 protein [Armatimonadetes bacterium]|nr:glycosyltransferase family 2 protein [Armatimonadota bacterium]
MASNGPSGQVTVIVVSYNTADKLERCLAAVGQDHPVIVVDNASSDGSVEMARMKFPWVRLIANEKNLGFGAANNQGLRECKTPLALLLNSDAYADPGAIDRLASVFQDEGVVAAGGRLLNPDRTLQQSSSNQLTLWAVFCEQTGLEKLFPTSKFWSPYWNSSSFSATGESYQVMGACLMMRPVELFDERFFLYCEDTELCYRLRKHGKILYVPEATFIHDLGSSGSGARWRSVAWYNRGKELYFSIHHGAMASGCCWVMDRFGALLRVLISLPLMVVKPSSGVAKLKTFLAVLFAPISGPARP